MTLSPTILQTISGNLGVYPDEGEEPFIFQASNRVLTGHGKTRPLQVLPDGKLAYWSIKEPLYDMSHTLVLSSTSGGVMTGTNLICKEVFVSELKGDERSLAGVASNEIDLSAEKLIITSSSVAPSTEKFITHREFYVNYQDSVGAYYLAARIPYTGGTDTVTVNVTADVLSENRQLEELEETSIFPAIATCAYWRSRIWGARLLPRKVATSTLSGPTCTLTNGSAVATLSAGGWREDDVYKGIVNYDTNEILAYVERILTSTTARIRQSNAVKDPEWSNSTVALTHWGLTGDTSTVFVSPLYVGEAGGGVTLSPTTWCPLNQITDENLPDSGSEIRSIWRVEDYLVIISDRAVLMYQGDVSVDNPPTPRIMPIAESVGSFNPRAVWSDAAGTLWFQGQGRIYTTSGGAVTDATAAVSSTEFYKRFVSGSLTGQRVSYNPELNASLIVNLTDRLTGNTLMLYIDHATGKIYGLTFPVAVTAVWCSAQDTGRWQWWIGAGKYMYRFMVRFLTVDNWYNSSDELSSAVAIPWKAETGYDYFQTPTYTVACEILCVSPLPQDMTLEVQTEDNTRLIDGPFSATYTQAITGAEADTGQVGLARIGGKAIRHRLSGESTCAFELYALEVTVDRVEQDSF
jgi:hypothetical protein